MLDIALLLCQILSKDITFAFKSAHIKTALDLFLKINKISEFPNIKKKESENKNPEKQTPKNDETFSRVVQSFRFGAKKEEHVKMERNPQDKNENISQNAGITFKNNNNFK